MIIIDYGMGNVGSILNMFKKIGCPAKISSSLEDIRTARGLVLPGVGAFDAGMTRLRECGMIDVLNERVLNAHVPILGVCLGMQLLSRRSGEGVLPGLGWVAADTVRFNFDTATTGLKIPHMGWNTVSVTRAGNLFKGLDDSRFYFVHSYHVVCDDPTDVLATTHHGLDFTASLQHGNIMGTQFHPEKSHKFGMTLYRNFAEAC